jgi:hypothetical protein
MYIKLTLCAALFFCGGVASAQIAERPSPVALDSQFVPVNLNPLANDQSTPLAQGTAVTFNKIPFDLAHSSEKNNLFLHNAGWPEWKEDPKRTTATYDAAPAEPSDTLPVTQIPTDDYSAVYILASCESDSTKYSNVLSLRIGAKNGRLQTTYHDFEFVVPRRGERTGDNVVRALPAPNNGIFLLHLPLTAALSQEFKEQRALDVEITKKIRLAVSMPDAARFNYRPLGLPSGVHLFGMTFERSPLRLALRSAETGSVFNQPQVPTFDLQLTQVENRRFKAVKVRARAVDYYGNAVEFPAITRVLLPAFHTRLQLPVARRGYYALTVTVEVDDKVLLQRSTTFALLPPNTRRYREQSPFGTWDFSGQHYTPNDADVVGPLYVKAGLRYGMFFFTPEERRRYGVLKGNDPNFHLRDVDKIDEIIAREKASGETPRRWLIFHEDAISAAHITRTPDLFTGNHYKLNAEEEKTFQKMWDGALEATRKIRAAFPGVQIYFANGGPQLMEEFLRHKYPADAFDFLGNEAASFQRLPESQPLDSIANNASLWMERQLLDAYGYQNKPLGQCGEIMYPSTNPGNLTLKQQASYSVRNVMHSLAWKIPIIRFGVMAEPGNSYYFSNWGGAGMMFGQPNLSPKPLYVATATMTQLLDGARFNRMIPSGTTTLYAFEFEKPKGGYVTCLWTPNTARRVQLKSSQPQLVVTDLMSNSKVLALRAGSGTMIATSEPVFIESSQPLQLQAGDNITDLAPNEKTTSLSAMDDAAQWQVVNGENNQLQAYNFLQPRRAGTFTINNVASFEGKEGVLEVRPQKVDAEKWWLPEYSSLKLREPVTIEGEPTHVNLMVNGNGGWGRIVFDLEDATGQRWTSLGAEQKGEPNPWLADWLSKEDFEKLQKSGNASAGVSDWNTNDAWGRSVINFTGWHRLQFPLPGNYPGEGYQWPYNSQWRCVKADGTRGDYIVHYPLKFTGLDVTARAKVLYGTQVVPVHRPEIYLKDLAVTYGDPDTAFWKPDPAQN